MLPPLTLPLPPSHSLLSLMHVYPISTCISLSFCHSFHCWLNFFHSYHCIALTLPPSFSSIYSSSSLSPSPPSLPCSPSLPLPLSPSLPLSLSPSLPRSFSPPLSLVFLSPSLPCSPSPSLSPSLSLPLLTHYHINPGYQCSCIPLWERHPLKLSQYRMRVASLLRRYRRI